MDIFLLSFNTDFSKVNIGFIIVKIECKILCLEQTRFRILSFSKDRYNWIMKELTF